MSELLILGTMCWTSLTILGTLEKCICPSWAAWRSPGLLFSSVSSGVSSPLARYLPTCLPGVFLQHVSLDFHYVMHLKVTLLWLCVCAGGIFHGYLPLRCSHHPVHPWHHPGWSHQRHQVLPDATVGEGPWREGTYMQANKELQWSWKLILSVFISCCRCGETQHHRSSTRWAVLGGVSLQWLLITNSITTASGWF